jgi:hypothetical protein
MVVGVEELAKRDTTKNRASGTLFMIVCMFCWTDGGEARVPLSKYAVTQ